MQIHISIEEADRKMGWKLGICISSYVENCVFYMRARDEACFRFGANFSIYLLSKYTSALPSAVYNFNVKKSFETVFDLTRVHEARPCVLLDSAFALSRRR